ncbi:putative small secreted protein [Orbus hercynius]|uniref:Putative small secreted protein n=1 Tax=Orbus hercynius TaxID=593135 RepID=A0A495RKB4_9GAMM|nr:putative small secreted protein [Orbus hercynius]
MKKMIVILVTSLVFLSGCNTIAGAGEDIQDGGSTITKAADDVKSAL